MKRCKTCKHWNTEPKSDWGTCEIGRSENMQPDNPNTLAVAYDFEGYMATLQTHVTFGCVQWEKKERNGI